MKTVFLVTHGEKETFDHDGRTIPNPGMTMEGQKRVKSLLPELRKILAGDPAGILVGTGKRHKQVLFALGFTDRQPTFSPIFGGPETLIEVGDEKQVVLASGRPIPWKSYRVDWMKPALEAALREIPDKSLICSGRPVLVRLGMAPKKCQNGALYAIRVDDDGSTHIELLVDGVNLMGHEEAAT